ncbi:MAG: metallophosphoesterase family protein [Lentisphaeria bacterium]|jgi:3',5'-cyclic AMP phosphodiesterase CpdA
MKRREFLSAGALLGASLSVLSGQALAEDAPAKVPAAANQPGAALKGVTNEVRFCAFADIHYYPGVFPHDSREWLEQILDRATREKVDFVIQAGDFTHRPKQFIDYVNWYNDYSLPTYHCIGNHDDDGNSHDVTLECYRLESGHYFFDRNGFRFIVADPNYFLQDGVYIHYSSANYYKVGTSYVPPEQLEWLKDAINNSPHPCVIFSHQSFEREIGGCKNYADVRKIINDANAAHPGRVRLVINGHHHRDNLRLIDNVLYFDLNSASYEWVPKAHDKYPPEVLSKHKLAKNTVMYNAPVNAIITMNSDGRIKIDGMESSLFMGITREMTGNSRYDAHGRETTARVQSLDITLNWG